MNTLFGRLKRLEKSHGGNGGSCGKDCPPVRWEFYRKDGPEAERVLEETEGPESCPRCGRPARISVIVEEIVLDREQADQAIRDLCEQSGIQRQ
jgi:hypothetical protein